MTARRCNPHFWAALLLAMTLAACGGGGGGGGAGDGAATAPGAPVQPLEPVAPTPPVAASTVVSGTVAAGVAARASVSVYSAATFQDPATSAAIAVATTSATGFYEATLPAGFAGPLLIRVTGLADGSSTLQDEVFGLTPITSAFEMLSVVPAGHVGLPGGRVTAHVTAYTHAMAVHVRARLGRPDIDAAVVAARALVAAHLTNGADPLTAAPTGAAMAVLLGTASHVANAVTSTVRNDPYACKARPANADKISCALKTVAAVLQPLAATDTAAATAAAPARLNLPYATALSAAAQTLDIAVVAANTGLPAAALEAGRTAAAAALGRTEDAATAAAAADEGGDAVLPLLGVKITRGSAMIIADGPRAGLYQGWHFALSRCLDDQFPCLDFNARATVTPDDVFEDRTVVDAAHQAAAELAQELNAIQRALYAKGRTSYAPLQTFISAINEAFREGLAARSVAAFAAAARAKLASAGYPLDATTADGGDAPTATEEQIAAAKACMLPEAYDNPTAPEFNPQLDANCRLAQVHACYHRAGITAYDVPGRANCRIVNGLIATLPGTWRCGYCDPGYPF